MPSHLHCVVCGRERAEGVAPAAGSLAGSATLDAAATEAAWGRFDGRDVCADCQTPDQRAEIGRRIVEAVEREVDRLQSEGLDPDPVESPLIAYAMSLRAAQQRRFEPAPDLITEHPDRARLRVAVTGAFLTGQPLEVSLASYGRTQGQLERTLERSVWKVRDLQGGVGTYKSGGGFAQELPLVIARREGGAFLPELATALAEVDEDESLLSVRPRGVAVDVYDLGVAVLTAELDVVAVKADLPRAVAALKQLAWLRPGDRGVAPLAQVLQGLAHRTADEFAKAVESCGLGTVRAQWASEGFAHLGEAGAVEPDQQGRLLWLHPVSVLHGGGLGTDVGKRLAPPFAETLTVDGGQLVAGIGWSALVLDATTSTAADMPLRLIQLHWAYYALYMAMDRGLLGVLDQRRWREASRLKQLEAEAEQVFADYLRVMNARARLDSRLSALGGDESAVWEVVAKVQRFDTIVQAVERKLVVLDKLAERRVELAQAYRTWRNSKILGVLTVLTVVSAVGGTVGVLAGAVSDSRYEARTRVVILSLAALVGILLYLWTFFYAIRDTSRRRSRRWRTQVQEPLVASARSGQRQPSST